MNASSPSRLDDPEFTFVVDMLGERPLWASSIADDDLELALRGIYTIAAAAAFIGTSETSVRRMVNAGILAGQRLGSRWFILEGPIRDHILSL